MALEYRTGAETTGRARNRIAAIGWAVGLAGMVAGLALPIFRLETLADALETEVTGLRNWNGRSPLLPAGKPRSMPSGPMRRRWCCWRN